MACLIDLESVLLILPDRKKSSLDDFSDGSDSKMSFCYFDRRVGTLRNRLLDLKNAAGCGYRVFLVVVVG